MKREPSVQGAALATAVVLLMPGTAAADAPRRRAGFTAEVSLGVGATVGAPTEDRRDWRFSTSGYNLGAGHFVNASAALGLRVAGTALRRSAGDDCVIVTAATIGPALQYWLDDHLFLGAAAGLAVLGVEVESDTAPMTRSSRGLDLRAGYGVDLGRWAAIHVAVEMTPGFYRHGAMAGVALQIGVQLL